MAGLLANMTQAKLPDMIETHVYDVKYVLGLISLA